MRINHNIASLNTYRQLSMNTAAGSKSLEKLSSGLRINRAGDDAAGLAISEKMRGQIRGLDQASRNAQDGISLIQTAEGALNETHSILQRMRELAVQSATDTNTDADRGEIQKEIAQLTSELDRISTDTEFNTKKLLDGSISNKAVVGGTNTAKILKATISDDTLVAGDYTVTVDAATASYTLGTSASGVGSVEAGTGSSAMGTFTLTLKANGTNFDAVLKDANGEIVASLYNQDLSNDGTNTESLDIGGLTFNWAAAGGTNPSTITEGITTVTVGMDATFSVANAAGEIIGATTIDDNTSGSVTVGGLQLTFDDSLATGTDTTVTLTTNAVKFQIGANEGQQTALAIGDMSSNALGLAGVDLSTREGASKAITTINNALEMVSAERAKLGAVQNRLEHTINNLDTSAENLTASESRIRDVDMAKEMMEFTKNNILTQAAQAMLAQANTQPQGVLQLLR